MTRILGADPGLGGALSLIDTDDWSLEVIDMPLETGIGTKNATSPSGLAQLVSRLRPDYSFVEDVWSSPAMGVGSAFSFGRSLGILLGVCVTHSSLTLVKPQLWKSRTGTPKDKTQARRRAMQLFPTAFQLFSRVKDDGRAESALIAFYGLLSLNFAPAKSLTLVPS